MRAARAQLADGVPPKRVARRPRASCRREVLAARAASDPGDKYVQMAHVAGSRTALAAMAKEGDEEEKGVAQAALDYL